MKKVRWIGGILIGVGVIAIMVHAWSIRSTPPPAPVAHSVKPAPTIKSATKKSDAFGTMAKPSLLSIPSLGITSPVRPVGMTPSGTMDIPDSLTDAGWYEQSVNPGNPGKAVMAVHTGYPKKPSKFRQLETIHPGDTIQVKDTAGVTATFDVIETAKYQADSAPLATIFGSSPTARLNIVTCSGAWDPAHNSYAERLVVFAARTE